MDLSIKKLKLIERLLQVKEEQILDRYTAMLNQAEMQSRTTESLKAAELGEVMDVNAFNEENEKWLKRKPTK